MAASSGRTATGTIPFRRGDDNLHTQLNSRQNNGNTGISGRRTCQTLDKCKKLEEKITQTQGALLAELQKFQNSYASSLQALKQFAEETRKIAVAKTTEDAQLVMRTAQEVVAKKEAVFERLKEAEDAKTKLDQTLAAFKRLKKWDERAQEIGENIKAISDNISSKEKEIEKNANLALVCSGEAQKAAREAEGIFSSATTQAQNVRDINEQVGAILSKVRAALDEIQGDRENTSNISLELSKLKEKQETTFSEFQDKADKTYTSLHKTKEASFQRLHSTQQTALSKLHDEYSSKLATLAQQIEKLLPGGTSIALSSAFEARKRAIEKYKWIWATLLAGSALGLILFGGASLFFSEELGMASSWSARFIVVGGLVVIEEFSRRNYNVSSRLAEAYAYKEALAKSYTGYKNELQNVNMPKKSEEGGPSASVLVKTFLDKLADEPGKRVFDRERTALGLTGFLDHVKAFHNIEASSSPEEDSQGGQPVAPSSRSSAPFELFRKVSWPVVSIVAILAATFCIVAWIVARTIGEIPVRESQKAVAVDRPVAASQAAK